MQGELYDERRNKISMFVFREKELKDLLDLIPDTVECRMRLLEEAARNVSFEDKIPECPVLKYFFILLTNI